MWRGISLANKCLLMFGGAIVLIVVMALAVPFLRMHALVRQGEIEIARLTVDAYERLHAAGRSGAADVARLGVRRIAPEDASRLALTDPFIAEAIRRLSVDADEQEHWTSAWDGGTRVLRFARAERTPEPNDPPETLAALYTLQRRSDGAAWLIIINSVYLLSAGFLVLGLAVLVFYLITHKIILGPVRALKETAEHVRDGDLSVRSDISTGDEFEDLAETFNLMVGEVQRSQEQLRSINAALDLKLNELAASNSALFEAARVKGEFLASVSHELRTPLNSIIGFTELLLDIARSESETASRDGRSDPSVSKRLRYLENIHSSGRNLLEMINTLLEMAKIEAGKTDLRVEPLLLGPTCDALLGLVSPLADKKGITLRLDLGADVPAIETDGKKLHQIIFNFLSNAVKFIEPESRTGRPGLIVLRVERLPATDSHSDSRAQDRVRISVIDNGPGIPREDQERIFDKFVQLDGSHTRGHTGTGLGLAICKELADLLQGEVHVDSEVGRGSMFSIILPLAIDQSHAAEQKLEAALRGTLAGRREWS
ncbi:MAG: HAMP domain-containing histidine kinase [Phycisphaeraceae bacterium]|nr:MAG: HAMP domain-containing histidine kinase [Phycisphaeraceae bacterium]